jgi:hypothetical protein
MTKTIALPLLQYSTYSDFGPRESMDAHVLRRLTCTWACNCSDGLLFISSRFGVDVGVDDGRGTRDERESTVISLEMHARLGCSTQVYCTRVGTLISLRRQPHIEKTPRSFSRIIPPYAALTTVNVGRSLGCTRHIAHNVAPCCTPTQVHGSLLNDGVACSIPRYCTSVT